MGGNVVKPDKCMGVSQLLYCIVSSYWGGARAAPQSMHMVAIQQKELYRANLINTQFELSASG